MKSCGLAVSTLSVLLLGGLLAVSRAHDQAAVRPGWPKGLIGQAGLGKALKQTPGCLGFETAVTGSGKQVIFAWFENKKALLNWYYSDAHREGMKQHFGLEPSGRPLKVIPENSGPILAIASFTPADKPRFKETTLPLSQLAIELYQPMPGGIFAGGRFAPESLQVPQMIDYTPKEK